MIFISFVITLLPQDIGPLKISFSLLVSRTPRSKQAIWASRRMAPVKPLLRSALRIHDDEAYRVMTTQEMETMIAKELKQPCDVLSNEDFMDTV